MPGKLLPQKDYNITRISFLSSGLNDNDYCKLIAALKLQENIQMSSAFPQSAAGKAGEPSFILIRFGICADEKIPFNRPGTMQ